MVKNLPAIRKPHFDPGLGRSPGVQGVETHSNILAWEIPWAQEPGGLQSMDCKESDRTE